MKILLINNNPVVSRLTALSARKEDIEIDEIQEVTELSSDTYDIVFVDADSWSKDVSDVISENIKTQKSVLFYADGDEEDKESFDLSILKPFLPSEVSAVIRSLEEVKPVLEVEEASNFNILDDAKESNREELFTLDGLDDLETTNDETKGLDFNEKLEEAFPLKINTVEDDIFEEENKVNTDESKELVSNELFDLDLSDEVPSLDDDLFSESKKEETLEPLEKIELADEVLELSSESKAEPLLELEETPLELDEPLIEEVKQETQVLDESEIEKIKGILTEDNSDDMTLEDLMPAIIPNATFEVEKETLKEIVTEEKIKDEASSEPSIDSEVIVQTLTSMPVESLRDLLAGATVNIKIKFPKSKK